MDDSRESNTGFRSSASSAAADRHEVDM
jgi:hypothetical protein